MKRVPVLSPSECTDCDSCIALCPKVFKRNPETGLMEVADLAQYPEDEVDEAIAACPADCISWEKGG